MMNDNIRPSARKPSSRYIETQNATSTVTLNRVKGLLDVSDEYALESPLPWGRGEGGSMPHN